MVEEIRDIVKYKCEVDLRASFSGTELEPLETLFDEVEYRDGRFEEMVSNAE